MAVHNFCEVLFSIVNPILLGKVYCGNELGKKKERKSNAQSKAPEFYVKNPNQKKSRSITQIHYIIWEITEERENLTVALYLR